MKTDGQPSNQSATRRLPSISAAVMTHPARLNGARQVLARLAPLTARLAVDPDPDGPRSAMRTARLAFDTGGADATHHLVVQDDVWLPPGFAEMAQRAVSSQPTAAISFFVEWGACTATLARWATLIQVSWVPVVNSYVPTQALVVPSPVANELARFLRTEATIEEPDDEAVRRFMSRRGTRTLVAVPNLVEHLELPSLTGNGEHGARRSVCLQSDRRPTTVHGEVLDVPTLVPYLGWMSGRSTMLDTVTNSVANRRPTIDVLGDWDCPRSMLSDGCEGSLYGLRLPASVRSGVGENHLFELWITAVAMGAILQAQWPMADGTLVSRMDDPVATLAMSTMAPGALRRFVDREILVLHADELTAFTIEGVKYGAIQCRAALRSAPTPRSRLSTH